MPSTMTASERGFSSLSSLSGWRDVALNMDLAGLKANLNQAYRLGKSLPAPEDWFRALERVGPPSAVRVVILGQDPYHGPGQAHGLAFSVPRGMPLPPSLRNVYKEIAASEGGVPPGHGDLSHWAQQGVLLLNDVLSVEEGRPGSHAEFGWRPLTKALLGALQVRPVCFMLWGRHAQAHKESLLRLHPDHCLLEAPHPSPLSAHRGFHGCGHFSKVNAWLRDRGEPPIEWWSSPW